MITHFSTTSSDLIADLRQEIIDVRAQNVALQAQNVAYGRSHLGILSGPAIRYELARLARPVDLVVFDWRKQAVWNDLLTWSGANTVLGRAACVGYDGPNRRSATRGIDLRGQYGGDEIVIAVDVGSGRGLLGRLLKELIVMNAEMSAAMRACALVKTGGLIDGFCIAAMLVEGSTSPLRDAARAVDMTGVLKRGAQTGCRATSGAKGTVIGRLEC